MRIITLIVAEVESMSPLFISDSEGDILMNQESGMAYIPATGIAGSFRAYLKSIEENYKELLGDQVNQGSTMSNVYISDAFARINKLERRDGVRIDKETGSNVSGAKIDKLYLGKGLKFKLKFEINSKDNKDQKFKQMIYKCLRALDKSLLRFGGNKSSGLGIFKVINAFETEFNLEGKEDWLRYLKKDYSNIKNIKQEIENSEVNGAYVEFNIKGTLTSPLLIKSPETYDPSDVDDRSIKSDDDYIIPGSSFKGILRSRVERIANYFGSMDEANEMFGTVSSQKNILSKVFVSESVIDNKEFNKEVQYNRIKIDRFTGGTRNTVLMNDIPVQGNTEFNIIYRKQNIKGKDNYAIGVIALALRDLGTENLTLGSGSSIGRGRFKAYTMSITQGNEKTDINFRDKTLSNPTALDSYIKAVKKFKRQEG